MKDKDRIKGFNQEVSDLKESEQLCDLDGRTIEVKFKVTKYKPNIVIDDI